VTVELTGKSDKSERYFISVKRWLLEPMDN